MSSIYNVLNSRRELIPLPAEQRLAEIHAAAWISKPGPQAWVWSVTFRSMLGVAGRDIIRLLDGLVAAPGLPGDADGGLQADLRMVRAALDGIGVNTADPETLPQLLLLKAKSPDFARLGLPLVPSESWDRIIARGWDYNVELGNATLDQVAAAASRIAAEQDVADLEAALAAHMNDVVRPRLSALSDQAAMGTVILPTLAELVGV